MTRILKILALVLLLASGVVYIFGDALKQATYDSLTANMFVPADTDPFDPGPTIGSHFPGVRALYQGREIRLLNPFAGPNGTLFMASRSFDWCPYCMRQLIQLQQHKPDFDRAGIGLVAMTYDAPSLQQAFIERHGITIPVLSDIDAMTFKTLGILNERYSGGEFEYGIPYPGTIVIDSQGKVAGKLFLEGYSKRVDAAAALAYARKVLGLSPGDQAFD